MVPFTPSPAILTSHLTHLAVRWIHVIGMAALFGGAALVWLVLRGYEDDGSTSGALRETPAAALQVAAAYEWLFWAGASLLVLTGVGNLGGMAPAIPGPATSWGATFSVKLVGVFGLLLGSLVRTVGVVGLFARAPTRLAPAEIDRLRAGYAATALYLLLVVLLAEVLAHG